MYKITNQITNNGFCFSPLSKIVDKENNRQRFNTLDFFCIFLTTENISLKIEDELHHIDSGKTIFVGPHKTIELSNNPEGKDFYIIAFSDHFYNSPTKNSILLDSGIFFNQLSPIFIVPNFDYNKRNKVVLIERLLKFYQKEKSIFKTLAHNTVENLLLDAYLHIKTST